MCSHYVKKSDSNSLAAHCARVVPGNPYVALELAPEKGCLTIHRYWRPRPWSHLRKAVLAAPCVFLLCLAFQGAHDHPFGDSLLHNHIY
jgi:hypothetical protein